MAKGEATLLVKIQTKGEEILDKMVVTLGDIGNVASLVSSKLMNVAKGISDLVFEGSKLEQIDKQFEFLAKNAGVAASVLKDQLVGAVGGMVDDTDLLKAANRALVNMNENASDLPKIMSIAKASAKLMGGEVVDRFEQITMAIQNVNARSLRGTGIIIDQDVAFKKYAATLGLTKDQLNKSQEAQAILNEVILQSPALLSASKASIDDVGASFKKMKISMEQLHEIAARVFNDLFGSTFTRVFKNVASGISGLTEILTSQFGKGAEKTAANVNRLTQELDQLNKAQDSFNKVGFDMTGKEANLQILQIRIKKTSEELAKFQQQAVVEAQKADDEIVDIQKKSGQLSISQQEEIQLKKLQLTAGQNALTSQNARDKTASDVANMFADDETKALAQAQLDQKNAEMQLAQNALLFSQATDSTKKLALAEQAAKLQSSVETAKFNTATLTNEKVKNDAMKAMATEFFGNISSLQSAKNKELIVIGKAAAIAQIVIAGQQSAAHAMTFGTALGGPPLGAVFAGLSYAASAAQVAKVAGVELAEGGIVMPRPGGTQATIGEAGQAEAVIPLDKMGGLGGGINITVNGGMLGDASSAREFAIQVDKHLLELRRNNESVAFDSRVI